MEESNITIVDYGLGNLRSVRGAFERVGARVSLASSPAEILTAQKLVIPGVGAFGDGMQRLRKLNLIEPLKQAVTERKIPLLGICLGAQLLCDSSTELGEHQGLGLFKAKVLKLKVDGLRSPHIGWNHTHVAAHSPLFQGIADGSLFYYVHSFHIRCDDQSHVLAYCKYGEKFTSVFQNRNILGVQFHPEKSQQCGLTLLKNFLQVEAW